MAYRSFEELDVWKESCRLAVSVHQLFNPVRDYAMRDQIVRSSISVPSNIAEGCERGTPKDTVRFLHIAKGSCAELRTQLYLSIEMGVVNKDEAKSLLESSRRISGMLQNLIKSLSSRSEDLKHKT